MMAKTQTKRRSPATIIRQKGPSRAERTRAKLIDAAIEEFSSVGFHETKISGIVARAGLTQPTFYLYFKTKDAIYEHLVTRVHDELLAVIEQARLPAQLPDTVIREKMRRAIETFLQYFIDNPKLAPIGYFAPDAGATIREEIVSLVARNVAFEQGAGYFRSDLDPVFASHCYNGSLERLIKVYLASGKYDARTLSEKVADIFLFGFLPPDAQARS
jgi:TetR/AcrR family transcriptional regulator, fatty acid metabolism regulator protein